MVLHFMEIENEESNLAVVCRSADPDAWPEDGRVNDIRMISNSNDKNVLFRAHSSHFSENLVDYSISSSTYIHEVMAHYRNTNAKILLL